MSEKRKPKNAGIWARDPHNFYIEPRWCSERLFEEVVFDNFIFDPACGSGCIVAAARAKGMLANGSDLIDRDVGLMHGKDFLASNFPFEILMPGAGGARCDIVCNPPFPQAEEFVRIALAFASGKVAMLLPATWHFGIKRAKWLSKTPLWRVLALTPRPSMPPGAVVMAGEKPGGGTKDFAWYIWQKGFEGNWQGGWLQRDRIAA